MDIKNKKSKFRGFTLAETLITLGIIGIVAALTLPTLVQNYKKKQYVTTLKVTYAKLNSMTKAIMAAEGVTRFSETEFFNNIPLEDRNYDSPEYIEYMRKNLSNYIKFSNVNSYLNVYENNYRIKNLIGDEFTTEDSLMYPFFLDDGTFLYIHINPNLPVSADKDSLIGWIRVDVNGYNKPNILGRDIFEMSVFDSGIISFYLGNYYNSVNGLNRSVDILCKPNVSNLELNGRSCGAKIENENWKMNY